MFVFVLAATALVALALAFVLPTLWTTARRSAITMLLAFPLGAAGLYALFGTPDALDPAQREAPETIEAAIFQLEQRLQREPDNLEAWVLLGRTRKNQGREADNLGDLPTATRHYMEAVQAIRRARDLAPEEIDLQVEMAEALLLADVDRRFGPEATGLLDLALARVPNHERALWLRGVAAVQAGDAATAVARWETLLPMIQDASADDLRAQIASARASAGMPPMAPELAGTPSADLAPGTAGTITIQIDADPAMIAALPPQAVLFVTAYNADAAGPPVAVKRLQGVTLPLTVTLSDADHVMPTAKLSATARVRVSARFARSGTVEPDAGDLVAAPGLVQLANARPITLRLAPGAATTGTASPPTPGE